MAFYGCLFFFSMETLFSICVCFFNATHIGSLWYIKSNQINCSFVHWIHVSTHHFGRTVRIDWQSTQMPWLTLESNWKYVFVNCFCHEPSSSPFVQFAKLFSLNMCTHSMIHRHTKAVWLSESCFRLYTWNVVDCAFWYSVVVGFRFYSTLYLSPYIMSNTRICSLI